MSNFKDFEKAWKGKDKTVGQQIKSVFVKEKPLRYKLAMAHYKINSMNRRLEVYLERLKSREKELFQRVVDALISKDTMRATIYANEVREIGEVALYLGPIVGVVKEVRSAVKTVLPEIGIELGEVQDMLQETVMEAGEMLGTGSTSVYAGPDARKIIEEAKVVAEQRMKEAFPSLPAIPATPSGQQETHVGAESP